MVVGRKAVEVAEGGFQVAGVLHLVEDREDTVG